MMQNLITVGIQVLVLFVLMALGGIGGKTGLIDKQAIKSLTNIVLYFVTPCVIIDSFNRKYDAAEAHNLVKVALIAVCVMVFSIIMSTLIFRSKDKDDQKQCIYRFATVFSNCGFMSLPLQQAIVGDIGVFYGAVFIAVFNITVWTWGVFTMGGGRQQMNIKKIILNPGILGVVAGMLVFFLQINLTDVVSLPISYLAAMNTPLPMIIIGYYLSELHMKDFIENKMQYLVIGLRLVLIPAALIAVLNLLHISGDIRTVCVIATCAPAAAMTTMFASKFDRDAELASRIVSISTLLSIITMPVIISFSQSI